MALPKPEPQVPIVSEAQTALDNAARVVLTLESYREEARQARNSGPNARDKVWEQNINLYWNRYDFKDKADWQAKEVMPEAPQFVDRWAAAMREALTSDGEWYSVKAPGDKDNDISGAIKKFMDVMLKRVGRNQMGQPMDFAGVFEEHMKLGAMMACSGAVLWRKDGDEKGYVSVEAVDTRQIWLDPTGRGLYRIRRMEKDLHDVLKLVTLKDENGEPLYDATQIAMLSSALNSEEEENRRKMTGHGSEATSKRKPIILDVYLCTLIDEDDNTVKTNQYAVIANERFLIRGPEANPFVHKRDWLLFCPLITVPLSVYGRSYMENWGGLASTFTELTNLILDGIHASALNAYAVDPSLLADPTQIAEGVHPSKVFILEDGTISKDFLTTIELGRLPPEVITVWQGMKNELREGAAFSEIALGQLPPKGDITATEITESQQGSTALVRSIARTVESRFLQPMLDLIWKLGIQHLRKDDEEMKEALGEGTFNMLLAVKDEMISRRITFRVSGISSLIDRGQKLRNLISLLQVMAQSEPLIKAFMEEFGPGVLVRELMRLHGVDAEDLRPTERERQVAQTVESAQAAGATAQEALNTSLAPEKSPAVAKKSSTGSEK